MHLGLNIKYLRRLKGMSQYDLGDFLEVGNSQISAYEKGKAYPRVDGLIKMAKLFKVNLDDFVFKDLGQEESIEKVEREQPGTKEETVDSLLETIVTLSMKLGKTEGAHKKLIEDIKREAPDLAKKWGIS